MAIDVPSALSEQQSNSQTHHQHEDSLHSRNIPSSHSSQGKGTTKSNDLLNNGPNFLESRFETQQFLCFGLLHRLLQNFREYSHIQPVIGLFVFYVGHDALQERMFRFDGFEFGFFMTLVEVMVMLIGSSLTELRWKEGLKIYLPWFWMENNNRNPQTVSGGGNTTKNKEKNSKFDKSSEKTIVGGRTSCKPNRNILGSSLSIPVLIRIAWVGLFLALAHGLGNTALRYSPYPLKVRILPRKLFSSISVSFHSFIMIDLIAHLNL